jgi:hypothetical protein
MLEAHPTDAGTRDKNSIACRFARASRRRVMIRTVDIRQTLEAPAAKRMASDTLLPNARGARCPELNTSE